MKKNRKISLVSRSENDKKFEDAKKVTSEAIKLFCDTFTLKPKKNITPFGIDKPHTFEKIKRVAVICPYKRDFLRFCDENKNDKKAYFHVSSLDSARGYIFDCFENGFYYFEVKDYDEILTYIKKHLPNENN